MKARALVVACLIAVLCAASARAQERLPLGTRVGSGVSPAPGVSGYDAGGRRDPFVTLLGQKKAATAPAASARPKAGLPGIALADVAVKGIVQNGTTTVAVLEGPGGRSFVGRSNDRLQDAIIKSIDSEGVTFAQQVVDAVGVARTRDVRKPLRQIVVEEGR